MAKSVITHIFCFDDHRSFGEDVKKRFSDIARYKVEIFLTRQDFLSHLLELSEYALCKVAILGIHDNNDHIEMIDHLSVEIKQIDPKTGIILLIPLEKMEEVKKTVKYNIDAFIPLNSNSILRIHNIVKKLISENSIIRFRKRRNFSFYILLIFFLLSILLIIAASLKLPEYF
jgi:hypothetical protein